MEPFSPDTNNEENNYAEEYSNSESISESSPTNDGWSTFHYDSACIENLTPYVQSATENYFRQNSIPLEGPIKITSYREKLVEGKTYQVQVETSNGPFMVQLFVGSNSGAKSVSVTGVYPLLKNY